MNLLNIEKCDYVVGGRFECLLKQNKKRIGYPEDRNSTFLRNFYKRYHATRHNASEKVIFIVTAMRMERKKQVFCSEIQV
jgi:hypothetical protein